MSTHKFILVCLLNVVSATIHPVFAQQTISSQDSLEQALQAKIIQHIPALTQKSKKPQNKPSAMTVKLKIPSPPVKRTSRITIVIDPGHGGHDAGTVNHSMKVAEKTVTLSVAKQLQKQLACFPHFRVILTRSTDKFIPLRERLKIARTYQADLFLSIHADGFIHPHARGASVFALSLKGATSEAAKWLAEKENYSELGGASLHEQDTLLRSVLINLSQTVTITQSVSIGQSILEELKPITQLHQKMVEKGAFIVLKSPDIPSLLIETGFLSNPIEARQLSSTAYQIRLTKAIARGINNYFQNYHKNKVTKSA